MKLDSKTVCALACLSLGSGSLAAAQELRRPAAPSPVFDCGYRPPHRWMGELRAAVERGEIPDPALHVPSVPKGAPRPDAGAPPTVMADDIFAFEDTAQVLQTNFSGSDLLTLMTAAANAMMTAHGDSFDFAGFWVNSTPNHTIGTAFYQPIENDVLGLGDPSTVGSPIFNFRPSMGLAGNGIEGFVMMWDVNSPFWVPGNGSAASFTRLVLGQEFEHRWALFLPDLVDGRRMQGDDSGCGRTFHWSWKVDGQGSSMEIADWVGGRSRAGAFGPFGWSALGLARLRQSSITFNRDNGGVFSYSDLYLMGYVSPAEMDAGNSQLRYMDASACGNTYLGPISHFSSADIVAAAGPRIPDSSTSQKSFRTGWIMIHQPGDAPDASELAKAVGILAQHQTDWSTSTLGRGTMDNTLP